MLKVGFIGGGNMALAMMGGMLKSDAFTPESIIVSDANCAVLKSLEEKLAVKAVEDNREVAQWAQIVFLTIKPQFYQSVIDQTKDIVLADQTKMIVTVAPGWTLSRIQNAVGGPCKIVRTMPNTPAFVGEGMTGACPNELVTATEMQQLCALLGSFGQVEVLPENIFDTFSALCGSSPAFVFMMIEAMADAAVLEGFPRAQAYTLVSQAVLGSAKMVLELGKHPGQLKDMVCSPGGSTIEGVSALEEKGMRAAFFAAIERTAAKARKL